MREITLALVTLASFIVTCHADTYMHNPRGSNNRLNEQSANRQNANRAFDSQNNNRGGYNVGDKTDQKAGNDKNKQYQMEYFMSGKNPGDVSKLLIEWTNQHGCGEKRNGEPSKLNCDIIIQYMDKDPTEYAYNEQRSEGGFRDGVNTQTQNYNANAGEQNKDGKRTFNENFNAFNNRKAGSIDPNKVYQESFEWYDKCQKRPRNKGLFTADQNVNQDRATHTRQNPGGTRRGYECPEERDYYPYWHPTPFKDIVVFTTEDRCKIYKEESFNVKPKGECVEKFPNTNIDRPYSGAETPEKCKELGGEWTDFYNYLEIDTKATTQAACEAKGNKWGIPFRQAGINGLYRKTPACMVPLKAPDCQKSPYSRHNHLGNGEDLEALRYEWKLPYFPSGNKREFLLRIRYNISTDDYDAYNTDSKFNGDDKSPVTNNPLVDAGVKSPLRLAINTAQFGRTFQDRSHRSFFIPRTPEITGTVHNLNVRGKRGNIVQTFPAVEYDYIPNKLKIKQNDLVHIQWTGSNSHNNGNPAGDGQAGDAGQGTGGTDRSNIVALGQKDDNFPMVMEDEDNICHNMDVIWQRNVGKAANQMKWYDICLKLGSAGYYDCKSGCQNALDTKNQMNNLLNNAPASFSGMVVRFKKKGTHYYTCTRNNNFTNRSQKGEITIE